MPNSDDTKLTLQITADASGLKQGMQQSAEDVKEASAEMEKALEQTQAAAEETTQATEQLRSSTERYAEQTKQVQQYLSGSSGTAAASPVAQSTDPSASIGKNRVAIAEEYKRLGFAAVDLRQAKEAVDKTIAEFGESAANGDKIAQEQLAEAYEWLTQAIVEHNVARKAAIELEMESATPKQAASISTEVPEEYQNLAAAAAAAQQSQQNLNSVMKEFGESAAAGDVQAIQMIAAAEMDLKEKKEAHVAAQNEVTAASMESTAAALEEAAAGRELSSEVRALVAAEMELKAAREEAAVASKVFGAAALQGDAQAQNVLTAAREKSIAAERRLAEAEKAVSQASVGGATAQGHLTEKMYATQAASRILKGELPIRALERLIATSELAGAALAAAFPIMGAIALVEVISGAINKFEEMYKKAAEAGDQIRRGAADIVGGLNQQNEALQTQIDKLETEIAKIEHKPQNNLRNALDEIIERTEKLASSIKGAVDSLNELLEKSKTSSFEALMHNIGAAFTGGPRVEGNKDQIEEVQKVLKTFDDRQANYKLAMAEATSQKQRDDLTARYQSDTEKDLATAIPQLAAGRTKYQQKQDDQDKRDAQAAEMTGVKGQTVNYSSQINSYRSGLLTLYGIKENIKLTNTEATTKKQKEDEEEQARKKREDEEATRKQREAARQAEREQIKRLDAEADELANSGGDADALAQKIADFWAKQYRDAKNGSELKKHAREKFDQIEPKAQDARLHQLEQSKGYTDAALVQSYWQKEVNDAVAKGTVGTNSYFRAQEQLAAATKKVAEEEQQQREIARQLATTDADLAAGIDKVKSSAEQAKEELERSAKALGEWGDALKEARAIARENDLETGLEQVQQDLSTGKISRVEAARRTTQLHTDNYNSQREEYQNQYDHATTDAERQKAKNQLDRLDGKYNLQHRRDKAAEAQEIAAPYIQASRLITGSFNQALNGWLRGTQTFSQAMQSMWQNMAMSAVQSLEQIVQKQIETGIIALANKKAQATEGIAVDAKESASKGWKSGWDFPFPLNLLMAPALASEASTGCFSFASFDVGTPFVPKTGMALIHEGERIFTAKDNAAMTQAFVNAFSGGGRRDNLNVSHTVNMNGYSDTHFRNQLNRNTDSVYSSVRKAIRKRGN